MMAGLAQDACKPLNVFNILQPLDIYCVLLWVSFIAARISQEGNSGRVHLKPVAHTESSSRNNSTNHRQPIPNRCRPPTCRERSNAGGPHPVPGLANKTVWIHLELCDIPESPGESVSGSRSPTPPFRGVASHSESPATHPQVPSTTLGSGPAGPSLRQRQKAPVGRAAG